MPTARDQLDRNDPGRLPRLCSHAGAGQCGVPTASVFTRCSQSQSCPRRRCLSTAGAWHAPVGPRGGARSSRPPPGPPRIPRPRSHIRGAPGPTAGSCRAPDTTGRAPGRRPLCVLGRSTVRRAAGRTRRSVPGTPPTPSTLAAIGPRRRPAPRHGMRAYANSNMGCGWCHASDVVTGDARGASRCPAGSIAGGRTTAPLARRVDVQVPRVTPGLLTERGRAGA